MQLRTISMIKKSLSISFASLAILALSACGESGGSTSTTKMTNVEVVDGTISDDMILLDTSASDGTAIDTSGSGDLYETIDKRPKTSADTANEGKNKATAPEEKAEPVAAPASSDEPAE